MHSRQVLKWGIPKSESTLIIYVLVGIASGASETTDGVGPSGGTAVTAPAVSNEGLVHIHNVALSRHFLWHRK